jgi:hypothetical protein
VEGLYYAFGDDSKSFSKDSGWYGCGSWPDKCSKSYKVSGEDDGDLWTVRARVTYHFADEAAEAPLK